MRQSQWAFAVVEMFHLIALAVLGGAVLIVNLRLLGIVLRGRPADGIARDLSPLVSWSLLVLVVSGILMVGEETMKCYYNEAFRWKMGLFAAALVFFLILQRGIRTAPRPVIFGPAGKVLATISLLLWFGVGVAGRVIGFL